MPPCLGLAGPNTWQTERECLKASDNSFFNDSGRWGQECTDCWSSIQVRLLIVFSSSEHHDTVVPNFHPRRRLEFPTVARTPGLLLVGLHLLSPPHLLLRHGRNKAAKTQVHSTTVRVNVSSLHPLSSSPIGVSMFIVPITRPSTPPAPNIGNDIIV